MRQIPRPVLPPVEAKEQIDEDAAPVSGEADSLLYIAWTIIANAGGGDWTTQTDEWVTAAERWRDEFHAHIGRLKHFNISP